MSETAAPAAAAPSAPAAAPAAPPPAAEAAPPVVTAAPAAPVESKDPRDRKAQRMAKLKADEGAKAETPAATPAAPAETPVTQAEVEAPKVEAPAETPAEKKPETLTAVDPSLQDHLLKLRADRALKAEQKVLEKRREEIEASGNSLAEREKLIKDAEQDLTVIRAIKEARNKKDIIGAVQAALGKDVSLEDALFAIAKAMPEEGSEGAKPATPEEKDQPDLNQLVAERVAAELTARREAEQRSVTDEVASAERDYATDATKFLEAHLGDFPYLVGADADVAKVVIEHVRDTANRTGKLLEPDEALRRVETRMALDAHPAEAQEHFLRDPSKYPAISKLRTSSTVIREAADALRIKLGRFPTAEETLKSIEEGYREAIMATPYAKPAPLPPAVPAPKAGITSEMRQTVGSTEAEKPKGEKIDDRRKHRMDFLRDEEARRKAATPR